jgi:mannitol-1-phosphate 5-dehydrogenase
VHRHPDGHDERLEIRPVSAVNSTNRPALETVLRRVSLVATSVGATVLPRVIPHLAKEARRRATEGLPPFNLILAENIHGAGDTLRSAMMKAIAESGATGGYTATSPHGAAPGILECSVGKMVPLISAEARRREPTTVYAEAFNTLLVDARGWNGPPPQVPEIRLVEPIQAWVDRKLYIHNFGHAAAAYLGFQRDPGWTYIRQAVHDPDVYRRVRDAMATNGEALMLEYPGVFSAEEIDAHIDDLLYRFASPSLGDTVFRVGRDLPRKLAPGDRIMGPLRLRLRHGRRTDTVEEVYRAALRFTATDETGTPFPADREFLARLRSAQNPRSVLSELSGLDPSSEGDLLDRLAVAATDW